MTVYVFYATASNSVERGLLQPLQHLEQITRDSHGSHITTCTSTLHNQRVAAVPLGVEADDVITTFETSNGTVLVEVLQTNPDFLLGRVHATYVTNDLTLLLSAVLDLRHLAIEFRQAGHELCDTVRGGWQRSQLSGDQGLNGERVRSLDIQTRNAGQDGQLAGNVHTIQVISRIRLGVSQLLSLCNDLTPLGARSTRHRGKGVEQERKRTREDTLNAGNLVTRSDEVLQSRDHGQSRANCALMVYQGLALCGGGEDTLPQAQLRRETLLVRGDHGDTLPQENGVRAGQSRVAGVVDQDGAAGGRREVRGDLVDGEGAGLGQ